MIKRNLTRTAAAGFSLTAIALLMSACGDGGGIPAAGVGGKVVDGYVNGATVTLDVNDDQKCTVGEPTATTGIQGDFSFPADLGSHMTCAKGGIDISTGAAFIGELKAPPGATQITPLTTLVQATIDSDKAAGKTTTPEAAAATVANNLGLGTTNLLTTDPVAVATTIPKLIQATSAAQTALLNIAKKVNGGADLTDAQASVLYSSAVAGFAKALSLVSTPVDLASTAGDLIGSAITYANTAAKSLDAVTLASAGVTVASLSAVTAEVLKAAAIIINTNTQIVAKTDPQSLIKPVAFVLSAPSINGVAVTTTSGSPYPVTVKGPLTNASLTIANKGTAALPANVDVGFSMSDATRVFDVVIKGATINADASVTVPTTATLLAYVKHANGLFYTATLGNIAVNNIVSSSAGVMTVDWSNALTALASKTGFSTLDLALASTYDVTVTLSGPSFALQPSASAVIVAPTTTVTIPGTGGTTVTGQGATFKVTVTK